jgi:hypothetical protein
MSAPPSPVIQEESREEALDRIAAEAFALNGDTQVVRDERDHLRSILRNHILKLGKLSFSTEHFRAALIPQSSVYCKCHRVDVNQCEAVKDNAEGATVAVYIQRLEPRLKIEARAKGADGVPT